MSARPVSTIALEVGGRLDGDDVEISRVVTDSRLAGPGALFVALAGERVDGSAFVADAIDRGAAAVLVTDGRRRRGPGGRGRVDRRCAARRSGRPSGSG